MPPTDPTRERLESWVTDFCADGLAGERALVARDAPAALVEWLVTACARRDVEPDDLTQDDLRDALLEHVARLQLPAPLHERMPVLARDLLAHLEESGRLEDGRVLGLYVAALAPRYGRAARGEVEPLDRPGTKLGRNDPCPCGSGKKYKRCCMKA